MKLLKQLFEGAGLPADFESKATTLFEASIAERVQAEVDTKTVALAEAMEAKLNEAKETFIAEQALALETFIDQTVLEWSKENAIAIDAEIKTEVAESFLKGLSNLFKEHSVKVSPDATGVVESLQKNVADLESQLAESAKASADSAMVIEGYVKADILAELTEGLADTQADRVAKLAEHFPFTDADSFKQKVTFVLEAVTGNPFAKKDDKDEDGKDADDKKADDKEADEKKKIEEAAAAAIANPADTKIVESQVDPLVAQTLSFMAGK